MGDMKSYDSTGQPYPSASTSSFLAPTDFSSLDDPVSRRSSQVSSSSSAGQTRAKRRFECALPGCNKSFNSAGHLARHNRTHTGEKAFPCTWEGCTSRFSRHDNMLQHYRGHINKNPRRRKPASTSATAALAASTSSSSKGKRSSVMTRSGTASGEPVFIHSSYSSLGNSVNPSQGHPSSAGPYPTGTSAVPYTSNETQSTSSVYDSSSSSASRHHSISPPSSTTSLRMSINTSQPPQPQQRYIDLGSLPPTLPSSMASGPPLASPSFIERPHTANEPHQDFFAVQPIQPSRPVGTLVHRHSYSTLPSLVTEPVTPLEEYDNSYLNSPAMSASSFSSSNTSLPYDRRLSYGLPASIATLPNTAETMISPAGSMHSSTLQHQQQRSYKQLQYVQQLPPVPSARHAYISTAPQRLFQSPVQVHSAPNTPMQADFHFQQSQPHVVQHHHQPQQQYQYHNNSQQQYSMGFSYLASPTIGAEYPSNAFSTYNTHDPPPPVSMNTASGLPSLQLSLSEPSVLQQPPPPDDDDTTPVFHPSGSMTTTMEEYIDPSYTVSPTTVPEALPSAGYVWPSKPLFPGVDGQDSSNQDQLPVSPSWYRGPPSL